MSITWCCRALDTVSTVARLGGRVPSFAALALLAGLAAAPAARAQYCTATATNCGTAFDDERISHVTFADIDNDSGFGDGPAGCYTDFTAITGHVQPGTTYTITVSNAAAYDGDWAAVWIDWNNDSVFDTATEQYVLTSLDGYLTFTGDITVPAGATTGITRMRVRVCYQTGRTPCGNAGYGEVEDYSLMIGAATTGACCDTSGACTQTVPGACTGTYQGLSSACNPNPCGGACCTGLTCTVTTAATCPGSSVYIDHGVCSAASCQYCAAGSAACGTTNDDERISHVTFNTIDNDSGAGDGPAGCYTDFTSISTSIFPGQSYPITVTNSGVYAADQAAVWIDFNGDYAFGDVASGEQTTLTSADGGATFTGTVSVPAGAHIGATRMRVRVCYTTGLTPCGNAAYGEVEDYSISIASATTGACCQASGACTETTPGACAGAFSGLATSCSPINPCGGACCDTAGTCSVTTAASCPSGSSFASGGVCSPTYCSGACCDANGACTIAAAASACTGTFSGVHTTCAPNPCVGACCNAGNGACSTSTLTGCAAGTTYQAPGSSCTPSNPCPQPPTGACCNSTTGACTQVFAVNCSAITSAYSGDNTTCDGSGFCPGVGTCCSSLGNCVVRYTSDCPGGLTSNTATSCTPGLCPATTPATCENFDAGSAGSLPNNWSSTSTGAGAAWVIDSVQSYSPSNAVFTNDVGSVSSQFLELPAVTAAGGLTVDFFSYYTTENTFDGWVVEYSTDSGGTWTDVAVGGSWVLNGYNVAAISTNFTSPIAGRPAFSGAGAAWTEHIATIPASNGDSVIIRFQMASDSSVASTGVWLDDICIGGIQAAAGNGVCCRGSTCSTAFASAAACAAAVDTVSPATIVSKYVASGACNTPVTVPGTLGNITSPCCYANFNHNASIEVQDIFDFLNDWFAGKKAAIVGGDGTTGTLAVQNIFDFLNSWFAGGCN